MVVENCSNKQALFGKFFFFLMKWKKKSQFKRNNGQQHKEGQLLSNAWSFSRSPADFGNIRTKH